MFDDQWQVFFGALAGISATLLGLAFVAFQMSRSWHVSGPRRAVAQQTLAEFLVPVLIGSSVLMPGEQWRLVAWFCGISGLLLMAHQVRAASGKTADAFDRRQAQLNVITFFVYAAILLAAVLGAADGSPLLAWPCLWLILSGSVEAFAFMAAATADDFDGDPVVAERGDTR